MRDIASNQLDKSPGNYIEKSCVKTTPSLHKSKIIDIWSPTPTTRAIRVTKPKDFEFKASQSVSLGFGNPEEDNSRAMSIANGPERDYLEFAARNSESDYKRLFFSLEIGDEVWMRGPKGKFILDNNRPAVMLAGGVGITPFISMLESIVDFDSNQETLLVYANHSPAEVAYLKELDKLAESAKNVKILYTVSEVESSEEWPHRVGRIDRSMVGEIATKTRGAIFYIAGSPGFSKSMVAALRENGLGKGDIRVEVFRGYKHHLDEV